MTERLEVEMVLSHMCGRKQAGLREDVAAYSGEADSLAAYTVYALSAGYCGQAIHTTPS